MAVGQYLGGPWTLIAPAAGFGIGLVGDMKFMKGHCKMGSQHGAAHPAKKGTDPVCGMGVDESKAEHQVAHLGKTYYFCALQCKKSFEENPAKYIGKTPEAGFSG